MPSKQKDKGNRFEYQVRDVFIDKGIDCKRAYASDGRSLGHEENVDLVAYLYDQLDMRKDITIQCKARKKITQVLMPDDNIFAQVIKQDYGKPYAVIRLDDLVELLRKVYGNSIAIDIDKLKHKDR